MRAQPAVAQELTKLADDPEFSKILSHAAMDHRVANVQNSMKVAPNPATQQSGYVRYVPCPACKQQIADFAAICPHCQTRLKATGTFAGRNTGPDYTWQEKALTIMAILILLFNIVSMALTWSLTHEFSISMAFSILGCAVSLGILFRNDTIMTFAKWIYILNLLGSILGLLYGFVNPVYLIAPLMGIGFYGFMVYLLTQEVD